MLIFFNKTVSSIQAWQSKVFRFPERSFAMPEHAEFEWKDLSFPKDVYESLVRAFYPQMVEFFKNEDNQKAFEKWAEERE